MANQVSIIGKGTKIVGEVLSEDVLIVAGNVEGNLHCRKVVLKDRCRVAGNIYSDSLIIEAGGIFDGRAYMDPNSQPTAAAPGNGDGKGTPDGAEQD